MDNRLLFSQWLGRRYVKKTCEKYEDCIDDIDIRALKIEVFSLLTTQTPQLAVAIARKLESKGLLNKEEKRQVFYIYPFWLQKKEVSESEAANMQLPVTQNREDFEKWLITYSGFSYAQCRKYIDSVEIISKSLYEVSTLLDLQSLLATLKDKLSLLNFHQNPLPKVNLWLIILCTP